MSKQKQSSSVVGYQLYPSLIDAYTDYSKSEVIYNKYWGGAENPSLTLEEYEEKAFQDLIDKINRVPKDLIKADIGTAFNELVDCLILGRNSEKVEVEKLYDEAGKVTSLKASYNGRTFIYPVDAVRVFAGNYKGAIPQMFVEGVLPTRRGDVRLYGYLDELMPLSVHDIKTTGSYEVGKFKDHSQHLVYPYCLQQMGYMGVDLFSYDVAEISTNITKQNPEPSEVVVKLKATYSEEYLFTPERDIPILEGKVVELIDFIEANRHLITNPKIFASE
nr:MAG TPA: hypothetical protein [Caudoviricetes sp.]